MRIISFFKFYLLLMGLLFVGYSFLDLGLRRGLLLSLGATFLSPFLFKELVWVRGVRKGDMVLITLKREEVHGIFVQKTVARARTGGRRGDAIEIEFNGKRASGEVLDYGGIFFPPEVGLLYYAERDISAEVRR